MANQLCPNSDSLHILFPPEDQSEQYIPELKRRYIQFWGGLQVTDWLCTTLLPLHSWCAVCAVWGDNCVICAVWGDNCAVCAVLSDHCAVCAKCFPHILKPAGKLTNAATFAIECIIEFGDRVHAVWKCGTARMEM